MAQHLLHGPQVGSPVEQVRRGGVPEGVGSERDRPEVGTDQPVDHVVDGARTDAATACSQEQCAGIARRRVGAPLGKNNCLHNQHD